MLKENKNFAVQTLLETAENINSGNIELTNDFDETITESGEIAGLVAAIAAYLSIFAGIGVYTHIQNEKFRKKAARESKAVTREELHEAYEFLTTIEKKIKDIFKTTKYKKYVDGEVIHIYNNFIDTSKEFNKKTEHYSFRTGYTLFGINLIKLSKMENKYDEIVVSEDRLNEYIKKETKELAKVCDSVRDAVNKNKFIKDNFQCMLVFNEGKTCAYCVLNLKHNLVLNTSKYLKTK